MKTRNISIWKLGFTAVGGLITAVVPCQPAVAEAVSPEIAARLTACLERAKVDPAATETVAQSWADETAADAKAGRPAALCRSMAQFHGGKFSDAALGFEALAKTLDPADANGAAALLGQAGWAWLRAKRPDTAVTLYGEALERRPDDADLWIDRAVALAEGEHFWDAIADLTQANKLAPQRLEPMLYRAEAYKALGQLHAALADANAAVAVNGNDPQALLLRGNLLAETGNLAGAKADWEATVRIDRPDGPQGRFAAAALARLPPRPEAKPADNKAVPGNGGKP